ncbi:MAG: penicillin-binding protein 2 [Bacteroidales bacterium]|jgi:penicillin-binding protein 2|nr:penicillin-binding protein 2 [Bacteroidales bacterium]
MKFVSRKYIIIAIFMLVFLIIWAKLFYLQILDVSLKISSENNSRRKVVVYPARGLIYDRNGVLLVCNEAAYDLQVVPGQVKEFDTLALCNDLGIDIENFRSRFEKCKKYSSYRPSVFFKQINSRQYAKIQEHLYKYHGFFVQNRTLRKYNEGIAAHVLGDVGEVNLDMLNADSYYAVGDYAGKSGVEQYYEKELRGIKGTEYLLVDVHNRVQGSYMDGKYDSVAIPGKNLVLTIDSELQKYGEKIMQNKLGSIVAIEPSSGEILVMVSSPGYDPQLLVGRSRGKHFDSLSNVSAKPLLNRAISPNPPGSIFKIAQAIVGLQEGVISKNTFYSCDKSKIGCHNHPPCIGVERAIQYSCNPYFYFVFKDLVQRKKDPSIFKDSHIGLDLWKEKILTLGFGKAFDIGLPSVKKGFIPGSDHYDKKYGKYRWAFSTIFSLSIGQGEIMATPLQLANFCAIISNRGYYYNPHIVRNIGEEELTGPNTQKVFTPFDKSYFDMMVEGMDYVVNQDYGTGFYGRIPGVKVCGKTGTVQNPHGKDHSVFVAFAPKDDPKIAIAVYIENAGFGGVWAAPVARLVMEKYLTGEISDEEFEKRIQEAVLIESTE